MGTVNPSEIRQFLNHIIPLLRSSMSPADITKQIVELVDHVFKTTKMPAAALGQAIALLKRKEPRDTMGDFVRWVLEEKGAKNGGRTVVYIVVGPDVPGYTQDVTFVSSSVHLKKGDEIEWQLAGGGDFKVSFFNRAPFDTPANEFGEGDFGRIRGGLKEGDEFQYKLVSLYGKPWPSTKNCPEIIIQR